MALAPLAILRTGLMTAVGHDAPSSCAAFRAKTTNPGPTRFMSGSGEWIMAHGVTLDEPERGIAKLVAMAVSVIEEVLDDVESMDPAAIPLLLCVAEPSRPGRPAALDETLLDHIEQRLGMTFGVDSALVREGRVSVAFALARARELIGSARAQRVLIVAVDSLLGWDTLSRFDRSGRLLTTDNSNGFIPGEGAGALLVGRPSGEDELICTGIGIATEAATIDTDLPLRADGLVRAIRGAMEDATTTIDAFDFRIADVSGEQYYFKECALALARTLHRPKPEFDLWHPSECIGETGALAGVAIVVVADAAARKGYARGPNILAQMSNDDGRRAACALRYGRAS